MIREITHWLHPYVTWLSHTLASQSALAPLLLLFLQEAGIPLFIPGDTLLAYTGYRLSLSDATPLWLAFCVAVIVVLLGSSILFFVARHWGHMVVHKVGKFIHLKESDLQKAEQLFAKYGVWALIIGRHLPGLRIPLTLFAGSTGMPYRTFLFITFVSTALWVLMPLYLGVRFGADVGHLVHKYVNVAFIAVVLVVAVAIAFHIVGNIERKQKP